MQPALRMPPILRAGQNAAPLASLRRLLVQQLYCTLAGWAAAAGALQKLAGLSHCPVTTAIQSSTRDEDLHRPLRTASS